MVKIEEPLLGNCQTARQYPLLVFLPQLLALRKSRGIGELKTIIIIQIFLCVSCNNNLHTCRNSIDTNFMHDQTITDNFSTIIFFFAPLLFRPLEYIVQYLFVIQNLSKKSNRFLTFTKIFPLLLPQLILVSIIQDLNPLRFLDLRFKSQTLAPRPPPVRGGAAGFLRFNTSLQYSKYLRSNPLNLSNGWPKFR